MYDHVYIISMKGQDWHIMDLYS